MRVLIKIALIIAGAILFFHKIILAEKNDNYFVLDPKPAATKNYLNDPISEEEGKKCPEVEEKSKLLNGWYLWEPYQYNQVNEKGLELTGMDVKLVHAISELIKIEVEYEQVPWQQHQQDLKNGTRDFAAGATYTKERAKYAHFSEPYRFEENSLFIRKDNLNKLSFNNITEYLSQIRIQNFRLGVIKGFVYADPEINDFIADPENADIIYSYDNDLQSLQALLRNEIDGFMADRVVGAAVILKSDAGDRIGEIKLNIEVPIHLMFSIKTVPIALVERYNAAIKEFNTKEEYNQIVKTYLYPVLLLQTINAKWFYLVGVIGTIAFAISGIAIAVRDNATFFATFIFAMLPSVGGGILRDVILNRQTVGIFLTPSYIYYIFITVFVGFIIIRLLNYFNNDSSKDRFINIFWQNLLIVCDALGQAAFVITGVAIALMGKIEPIQLWGPFFAFLTANGGGILRDLIRKKGSIICLSGEINAEISIIWGFIFATFLEMTAHNPDSESIQMVVVITIVGAFVTRLVSHYFKIPNLRFINS